MINNTSLEFKDAIKAVGMEPPEVIEPTKFYRFPGLGKNKSNRAGWCKLFADGNAGSFGDWSSGFSQYWQMKRNKPYSFEERAEFNRQLKAVKAQALKEQITKHTQAAIKAKEIWKAATTAPYNYPYLKHKGIRTHGAKVYRGALVLPVLNIDKQITSLQFIDSQGRKRLLSGGRKQGCFIPVAGTLQDARKIIISEGWATVCTLAEGEPTATALAAIDAGNLEPLALSIRQRLPNVEMIIAGDDDRLTPGNPGVTKARAAAVTADALLAFPQWPEDAPMSLTDFNDLAIWLARRES